ncbi:MAG: MerR family transcriptional regulator [Pseudomonadales bacterium RIFCSPLOWO2_12_59_9]|nr:helix-turn-helix domain-containing protein [Pseudomonas sp.]OHC25680.1 MAG: MerR family transcriptional regulator [Pseudomonadales bacterium RIFCSPLOWO2_12_59_9]
MNKVYRIGELSRESAVNLETIRYYERIGLLQQPARNASGYRCYQQEDVRRLSFIRRGRELGFSIEELKTLLQLADHPHSPCAEADQLAQAHLQQVDARIADLQQMRSVLQSLVGCSSTSAEHCRLLETLDRRDCCVAPVNYSRTVHN